MMTPTATRAFSNPLLDYGPDPWAVCQDEFYYYLHSTATDVTIWKTSDLTQLADAERKIVWTPPETGPCAKNIWAPRLHRIDEVWHIYFSADDERGMGERQRMFVLENESVNPMSGSWTLKGELRLPDAKWAIDGTTFVYREQRYFAWAGWAGDDNRQRNIYLCRMTNPWTAGDERVALSEPTLPWERYNHDPDPASNRNDIVINEGPTALIHNDRLFLVYSASGCWTDHYCLGMLTLAANADPMKPESWVKTDQPVFQTSPENGVYAPGHNCFFQSPNGENWLLYHANPEPGLGCEEKRTPRMQLVCWLPNGTPDFGVPVATGVSLTGPGSADGG